MDALMDSQRSETLDRTRSDRRARRDFCQMPDMSRQGLVQRLIAAQQTAITEAQRRADFATDMAYHLMQGQARPLAAAARAAPPLMDSQPELPSHPGHVNDATLAHSPSQPQGWQEEASWREKSKCKNQAVLREIPSAL